MSLDSFYLIYDTYFAPQKVPEFEWHIIEDKVPFEIKDTGVRITPFLGWPHRYNSHLS